KFNDLDGDGTHDAGEPGLAGVTINLTGTDGKGNAVSLSTSTGVGGSFDFPGLHLDVYPVSEAPPVRITPAPPTRATLALISGQVADLDFVFVNFPTRRSSDLKFNDLDGDGTHDAGEPGLAGVTINLTGTDGKGNAVSLSTSTGVGGS